MDIIFKTNVLSFKSRAFNACISWGTMYILMIIILCSIYLNSIIAIGFCLFLIYDVFKTINESKVYILELKIVDENIEIDYLFKNEKRVSIFNISKIKFNWYLSIPGNRTPCNIKFYFNNDCFLVQYGIGMWTRSEIERVSKELKTKL